jgi:hypothetical protein
MAVTNDDILREVEVLKASIERLNRKVDRLLEPETRTCHVEKKVGGKNYRLREVMRMGVLVRREYRPITETALQKDKIRVIYYDENDDVVSDNITDKQQENG